MIIRKIKKGELRRAFEIANIAFEFMIHDLDTPDPMEENLIKDPKSRFDLYCMEHWAAFLDDDSTMVGSIMATPYKVIFDGHVCNMGGVGAVSTLPEYRRLGAIGCCIKKYLNDAYKNGDIFSSLFPFSRMYYRKYGYEMGSNVIKYSIDLRSIKKSYNENNGCVKLLEHGENLQDVKKVYSEFTKPYNLSSIRDDIDFYWLKKINSSKEKKYIYLFKNAVSEAKAFMFFEKVSSHRNFNMECSNFYFSDKEGLLGLLEFSSSFSNYYSKICFKSPENIKIQDWLQDIALYPLERELQFNGMVRVINVVKALEMAKYRDSGFIILKIEDPIIYENNNTFRVSFKDGKAFSVLYSKEEAEISLSINDFSRFILGTHDVEDILLLDNLNINCSQEKLRQIFYKKPIFISELF